MTEINWTHPSALTLIKESGQADPVDAIAARARDTTLDALEKGWAGPPFDPFELARILDIPIVPREDLEDARLIPTSAGCRIEFNPRRGPARIRFSIAHELGHYLFSDHGDAPRFRDESHRGDAGQDGWQLEVLCNVAAAELLMPVGTIPPSEAEDLRLTHLIDLRRLFEVSTEALLRRILRLTDRSACMFASARLSDGSYRIDYSVESRAWRIAMPRDSRIPADSAVAQCTAVGYSIDSKERWPSFDDDLHVQAVSIPSYPGHRYPRVIGLLTPVSDTATTVEGIHMVRGDATNPRGSQEPVIIAHIVNNRARSWGGKGFAKELSAKHQGASREYSAWASESGNGKLGQLHLAEDPGGALVASLVAQSGYGESSGPRLRLRSLAHCLEQLSREAKRLNASVHMPAIGTGQAGGKWPPIRDLIIEMLVDQGIPVTVYVLPEQRMPDEQLPVQQLTLA